MYSDWDERLPEYRNNFKNQTARDVVRNPGGKSGELKVLKRIINYLFKTIKRTEDINNFACSIYKIIKLAPQMYKKYNRIVFMQIFNHSNCSFSELF